MQILIHVGLNTVQLEGKGFKSYVQQGDKVRKGQRLLDFNIEEIEQAGYNVRYSNSYYEFRRLFRGRGE